MRGNPKLSYPRTPEHNAKISAAKRGKKLTDEHREKISAAQRGKTILPEQRAAISDGMKGKKNALGWIPSSETRLRISVANTGKHHTPETRAKLSIVVKRQWENPEHRAKISASQKGNTYVKNAPILGECIYCFEPATSHDHVIPQPVKSKSCCPHPGWDDPKNLVICCFQCNLSKGHRTPEEWFAQGAQD